MKAKAILTSVFFILCLSFTFAIDADLKTVEITVNLRPDGKADIYYTLEWHVSNGTMSGFYFEGEAFDPIWNSDHCYADLENAKRVPLEINNVGEGRNKTGKYDVILSNKQRFSGKAYYFLHYAGDFSAKGLVGKTVSPEKGALTYFNWGPVWWDDRLDSRTVRLVLPIKVNGEKLTKDEKEAIPILTEKHVNAKNKIDYYGTKGDDGSYYLTILFFDEGVAKEESQLLTLYFPENYINFSTQLSDSAAAKPSGKNLLGLASVIPVSAYSTEIESPKQGIGSLSMLIVLLPLAAASVLFFSIRARNYKKNIKLVSGISWAGNEWTAPKLFSGTYQVAGKIAKDLNPVEVALMLELELTRIVSIMLDGLIAQKIIKIITEDPLKIQFITENKASSEIEEMFLATFDADGNSLPGLLADFFDDAIKKLQEKTWDCDIEATKDFYRKKILEAEKETSDLASISVARSYTDKNRDMIYWHSYAIVHSRPKYMSGIKLAENMRGTYYEFMKSSACYSGCFTPSNHSGAANACYSACHNACHDACHDACHSACHDACHSACHSACVSGGAH